MAPGYAKNWDKDEKYLQKNKMKFKYKVVDKHGKVLSKHYTKKQAEAAQMLSGVNVYVRKCK